MRIDLLHLEAWDHVCDQYRAALPIGQDSTQTIQIYRGYSQALIETAQGIAKIFSHKKKIAIVADAEPVFETISQIFSSDGYDVIPLRPHDLLNPAPWFEPCKDELLFVLHAEDDPVTGAIFDHSALRDFFKEKRIFRIHLSHANFRESAIAPSGPFEARILSLRPDRALLIGGSRCKIRPTLAPFSPWSQVPRAELETDLKVHSDSERAQLRELVQKFESNLREPFQAYFKTTENSRVYDRAVFYADVFDGLAVVQGLSRHLGADSNRISTFSPCLWGSERLVEWRRKLGESDTQIRGLVTLAGELAKTETLDLLATLAADLIEMQNG